MTHRSPPISYGGPGRGTCVLCGDTIYKPPKRGWRLGDALEINTRKSWHTICAWAWRFMTSSQTQRDFLAMRDNGICADTGQDCNRSMVFAVQEVRAGYRFWNWWDAQARRYVIASGPASRFEWRDTSWHADHEIPLWKAPREAATVWRYWGPDNVQTLSDAAHKRKSAREAAERAHIDRLAGETSAQCHGTNPHKGRLQSRGFRTDVRRTMAGKVVAR